ncbi:hypothetical protein LOTGIDRAFT_168535 [Lottia gigantea]|uniref:Uncharacterized protein n=1 Tax=Lottia gigantea TaxID=225164 RepID=V3ZQ87_LOTGI|nr:hypothetical protein LOTGIDRAFT_168535 [Lottia gigantea]ESO84670.1 hypothetical protein LOTGIDRAFT_168535 [Lottia gigantea]
MSDDEGTGSRLNTENVQLGDGPNQHNDSDIGDGERLKLWLKRKRIVKSQLTKARLALTALLCSNESHEKIKNAVGHVLNCQEEAIDILLALCDIDADKFEPELELIQSYPVLSDILNKAYTLQFNADDIRSPTSSERGASPNQQDANLQVDKDMYHQLKRVTIPKFNGNKLEYQIFMDAFKQCIDQAKCSDGYKMLQLRQYLEGDAYKAIE